MTDSTPSRVAVKPWDRRLPRAVLAASTEGARAVELAGLPEDDRLSFVADNIRRLHPGLSSYVEGGTTYAWTDDPWMRGGLSSYRPGQFLDFYPVVARPEGRIHFAGEHTCRFSNQMDGAVASGRRAAREVDEAAKG